MFIPFNVRRPDVTEQVADVSFALAKPHFGKYTWASSANRSRMLPPVEVTPAVVERP